MRNRMILAFSLCVLLAGCERIHTETAGGGKPATNPQYDAKLQNPNPNFPGNKQPEPEAK